jgi:hypothetical protein
LSTTDHRSAANIAINVLDVARVEAELPDVGENPLDRLGIRRINEHQPPGSGDQIGADVIRPDIPLTDAASSRI